MKKWLAIGCALMIALTTAACGNSAGNSGNSAEGGGTSTPAPADKTNNEPATLKVYFLQNGFVDTDFNEEFQPFLSNKFPNIKFELINPTKGVAIEDIVASGDIPDLISSSETDVAVLKTLNIPLDLNPMIKQYKVDMNSFYPVVNSSVKRLGDNGETYTMMFGMQNFATFYNKDIFDKFGVTYPKDGMSWDDLIGLAKKLSREADGQTYYGLQVGNAGSLVRLFDQDIVDEKTQKALIDTPGWKRIFDLGKTLYTFPGNLAPKAKYNTVGAMFYKDQNVAMTPYYTDGYINNLEKMLEDGKPMNWDMSTHPSMADAPGKSHEMNMRSFVVSRTSKYKDQAFQVAAFIATSPEIQGKLSQNAYGVALKDDKYKKMFGQNRKVLQGKNIDAIFKTTPLDIHHISKFDDPVRKAIDPAFYDFLSGVTDENTAIRQAQEAADKAIADAK